MAKNPNSRKALEPNYRVVFIEKIDDSSNHYWYKTVRYDISISR